MFAVPLKNGYWGFVQFTLDGVYLICWNYFSKNYSEMEAKEAIESGASLHIPKAFIIPKRWKLVGNFEVPKEHLKYPNQFRVSYETGKIYLMKHKKNGDPTSSASTVEKCKKLQDDYLRSEHQIEEHLNSSRLGKISKNEKDRLAELARAKSKKNLWEFYYSKNKKKGRK